VSAQSVSPVSATTPAPSASVQSAVRKLSPQQLAAVAQLQATDRHVRAHEEAHLAAAGPYATSGASYTYTVGPDGNRYATGGEVTLDLTPDPTDPRKTLDKARTVEAAANAPVDPSSQDRMVAAEAAQMAAVAEQQIAAEQQQKGGSAYQPANAPDLGQLISVIA